jgi:type I restriction enzyme S subunit
MSSAAGRAYFLSCAKQTTNLASINKTQLSAMPVPVPPPIEQQRIAEILDSTDDQIRRTEQIVVKLCVQKSGLLQQLIGEESTKNLPYHVGDALLRIDAGWSPLCNEEPPFGDRWGVLKVSAVTSGRYIPSESKTLLAGLAPRPEIEVQNGDVIMCRANGAKELVGAVAMIRDTPPKLMLSDKTLRLIANTKVLSPAYLCHFMESWPARKQIGELLSGSSGQNNISQKLIRSMRIPIPDLPRQQQIVEALSVAENRIEAENSYLEGLQKIKQGLIDDLLMGRVRVPALPWHKFAVDLVLSEMSGWACIV